MITNKQQAKEKEIYYFLNKKNTTITSYKPNLFYKTSVLYKTDINFKLRKDYMMTMNRANDKYLLLVLNLDRDVPYILDCGSVLRGKSTGG